MGSHDAKFPYDMWLRAAVTLCARLDTIAAIYSEHDYDVQQRFISDFARRLHEIFYGSGSASSDPPAAQKHSQSRILTRISQHMQDEDPDELVIRLAAPLFGEAIEFLPFLSKDMESLLACRWREPMGRRALDLFRGPIETSLAGIMSGHAEDGGLAEFLSRLLRAEETGTSRPPRFTGHSEATAAANARATRQQKQTQAKATPAPKPSPFKK